MLNLRHNLTIFFFLLLCFLVIGTGLFLRPAVSEFKGEIDKGDHGSVVQENYFKNIKFFVTKEESPFLQLKSSETSINSFNGRTVFFDPEGKVYNEAGQPLFYQAKQGIYLEKAQELFLKNKVNIRFNKSQLTSDQVTYKMNKEELTSRGNVRTSSLSPENGDRILITSDRAYSWPKKNRSQYLGNVRGEVTRRRVYEESVKFGAEKLTLDMNQHLIQLNQNVSMEKQALSATGLRGEIFLENYNKKLKYFLLYDDVKVVEKVKIRGENFDRRAFAEKLEGVISEGKIILTGYPKVYQLQDVIKGNRIILRENNEVVEVDDANTRFKLE